MWKVCFRNEVEPGVLLLSAMEMHIKTSCKMYIINAIHEHLSTCWIVQLFDNYCKDPNRIRMCAYMSQRLDRKRKAGLLSWRQKRDGMVWESEQKMWILNKLPLEGKKVHLCVLWCAELPANHASEIMKVMVPNTKALIAKKAAGSNLQFFLHFYTLQADNGTSPPKQVP